MRRVNREFISGLSLPFICALSWLPFFKRLDLVSYDGTYYLNQAKAIVLGTAPAGVFPIGYPFFVACLLPLVNDLLLAGQIVSILFGMGSVIVIYLIAREYMGLGMALLCASFLATTPLFARYSMITMSEAVYIFWVLLGLLLFIKRRNLTAGLSIGVAAVTRPEAVGILAALTLIRLRKPKHLALLVGGFAIIYSLNVAAFYSWSGRVELLPKRSLFGASAEQWESRERSVSTNDNLEADGSTPTGNNMSAIAKDYVGRIPDEMLLWGRHAGPWILLIAIWGVITTRKRSLLACIVPLLVYPLFTPRSEPRFILPYIPVAVVFAFAGTVALRPTMWRKAGYAALVMSAVLGFVINRNQLTDPSGEGHIDAKKCGRYLRSVIKPGDRIADRKPYLAFYAGGEFVEIPAGSYEATMDCLIDDDVDYLFVHPSTIKKLRPELWPLAVDREVIRGELRFKQALMEGKCVFLYKRTREIGDLIWTKLTEPADGFDDFPAWSPDGTRIAFNSTRDGNSNIYVIPAEGGDPRRLTDWPGFEGFPAWSPDGKTLAFCSNRDGEGDIFALELDTGRIDRITSQEGLQLGPSWANDAGEIFFFSHKPPDEPSVWYKNLETGGLRRISGGAGICPAVSPQGDRLAWIEMAKRLVILDLGDAKEVLVEKPTRVHFAPTWSPDGKYIAITANDWGSPDVYVLTSDGSVALLLTKGQGFEGQPSWSPSGDQLAIVSDRAGEKSIWILDGLKPYLERLSDPTAIGVFRDPKDI